MEPPSNPVLCASLRLPGLASCRPRERGKRPAARLNAVIIDGIACASGGFEAQHDRKTAREGDNRLYPASMCQSQSVAASLVGALPKRPHTPSALSARRGPLDQQRIVRSRSFDYSLGQGWLSVKTHRPRASPWRGPQRGPVIKDGRFPGLATSAFLGLSRLKSFPPRRLCLTTAALLLCSALSSLAHHVGQIVVGQQLRRARGEE